MKLPQEHFIGSYPKDNSILSRHLDSFFRILIVDCLTRLISYHDVCIYESKYHNIEAF